MEDDSSSVEKGTIAKRESGENTSAVLTPSGEDRFKEDETQVVLSAEEVGKDAEGEDEPQNTTETSEDLKPQTTHDDSSSETTPVSSAMSSTEVKSDGDIVATPTEREVERSCKKLSDDVTNRTYYVKWILWKDIRTPIVTQNDNGPCPLLAIINILLLRRAITFPTMQEMVTTGQLMEYLGDHVLKEIPENLGEGDQRNFEQNMQDVFSILPKLKTGLDVNVKFTGVGDFEFTPECVIFDLLKIHLYHGWLVDPQNIEYQKAIGGLSYNQLVEKIIAISEESEESKESQVSAEGLLAESFLQETANQLTYHGLCELNAKVKQDELCVFFRNNHFSTLYKHQNQLFLLLTDQGFLTEDQIVWQTLSNVDGDGSFVDNSFKDLPLKQQTSIQETSTLGALSQEDQDYMLALSIQTEQQQEVRQPSAPQDPTVSSTSETPIQEPQSSQQQQQQQQQQQEQQQGADNPNYNPSQQELLDLQYAMNLQEEENQRNEPVQTQQERRTNRRETPPQQQPVSVNQPRESQERKNCLIL